MIGWWSSHLACGDLARDDFMTYGVHSHACFATVFIGFGAGIDTAADGSLGIHSRGEIFLRR